MRKIKYWTDTELATLYSRLEKVLFKKESIFYAKFEELHWNLRCEIDVRNRARIYRECCYSLRNRGRNQFASAKQYADAVINGSDYFTDSQSHEIGSYYSKTGCPIIVDLVMHGYYPFS